MRTNRVLAIAPAASWRRRQQANEFFLQDLDERMKENHRQLLQGLMPCARPCLLNAQPYERSDERVDQANGFYERSLTTRRGGLRCASRAHGAAVSTARRCRAINAANPRSMKP